MEDATVDMLEYCQVACILKNKKNGSKSRMMAVLRVCDSLRLFELIQIKQFREEERKRGN